MAAPAAGDWTVFLAELRGFFETCGEEVDDALTAHFGFDTAVDWIAVSLELVTEHLQPTAPPANSRKDQRD
ncbi:hypothetical protein SAMN04487980_104037 [Streptomyces sp. cf124]|uniref:hypothetical protein n=1 Tax=Streptomyces sp. cf124 TaxID=1761903 RepID=UPI0008F25639|nr:hypothetical protein [Streptomyces sp. cf124]SFN95958.1 hypothetical protein SAMN04487980_104037 [Streptomyces sp. cf124]